MKWCWKSLTVKAILNHLPTQLHMSFDEFKMQGQNTSGIATFSKHIGYISQNYAQSFNEYTRLDKTTYSYLSLSF